MSKIAVFFPGIGYSLEQPLLHESKKMVQDMGYDVLLLQYHDMPERVRGDKERIRFATVLAYEQTEDALDGVPFDAYEDVVFVAKSLGTIISTKYANEHKVKARMILYTPVEPSFDSIDPAADNRDIVGFIGEDDIWSDVSYVKELATERHVLLFSYPKCDHSLECGIQSKNEIIFKDIMAKTSFFIEPSETPREVPVMVRSRVKKAEQTILKAPISNTSGRPVLQKPAETKSNPEPNPASQSAVEKSQPVAEKVQERKTTENPAASEVARATVSKAATMAVTPAAEMKAGGRGILVSQKPPVVKPPAANVRKATRSDVPLILDFIRELAAFENQENQVTATELTLGVSLFVKKSAEVMFVMEGKKEVGFALFSQNYSVFQGCTGMFIESAFVRKEYRGKGYGTTLFREIAKLAAERGCGKMEWYCRDANKPGIDFYNSTGAKCVADRHVYRMMETDINRMANEE